MESPTFARNERGYQSVAHSILGTRCLLLFAGSIRNIVLIYGLMTTTSYLELIKSKFYPSMYPKLSEIGAAHFILRDGRYLFYCLPLKQVDLNDIHNKAIKARLAKTFKAFALFREFGLFLHIYGPVAHWGEASKLVTVDKTALRPIIVQNVNFIDPETGDVFNNRTAWGPIKFGFCGKVIEVIEAVANEIKSRG